MKKIITSFFILSWLLAGPVLANITPNDSYYNRQWYLSKIKADQAWTKISASPDIVIAVIDSGIQIIHPDLRNNIWHNDKEISGNGLDDDRNGFIDDYNGWNFIIIILIHPPILLMGGLKPEFLMVPWWLVLLLRKEIILREWLG